MALNPKTVPMLVEATPETIQAAKYYKNTEKCDDITLEHKISVYY